MSHPVISMIFLIAVGAPPMQTSETPTTRLFVRTIPPGAEIILDAKSLGKSNGLFLVSPGVRKVTIELDGYARETQEVKVRNQRIRRLEITLRKEPKPTGRAAPAESEPEMNSVSAPAKKEPVTADSRNAAFQAATEYLSQADIRRPIREAMLTVLRQHPSETRWAGQKDNIIFAVATKSLPTGAMRKRATPAFMELVHTLAIHELLKAKSLLDRYANSGLSDATTLRLALEQAAGKLKVGGRADGVTHQAAVRGDFVVAYVHALKSTLTAHLFQATELETVKMAYRDVMHRQARELMEQSDWENALLLWQHLHKRKLVSQHLYLDAAQCFKQLNREQDMIRILSEATKSFSETGSPAFFEQIGDTLLETELEAAIKPAEKAYIKASQVLRNTVSTIPTDPDTDQLPKNN